MSFNESVDDLVAANETGLLGAHSSWARIRLEDVCTILNGYPFSSKQFNATGGTPLIRIRDVMRGWSETFFEGKFDPAYIIGRGDLIVGMDGDFNCALWAGGEGLLNQRVCKLSAAEQYYDLRLLAHVLPGYLQAINAKTSAITVKHLSSKTISDIPLPLPPRQEQAHIVEAIDSHLSRLDDAMATLERVQRNLKRYRASVLKAAVEGRLVPTEAELARAEGREYEPASVLLERILAERRRHWEEAELAKLKAKGKVPKDDKWKARYVEPAAPDASELPELPEGWCWTSVEQLIAEPLANGRSVKTASTGFPVLRLTALKHGAIDLSEQKIGEWTAEEAEKFLVRSGDFLVARGNGSIRLVGIGGLVPPHSTPVAYPDTMIRICLCNEIEPRFFMLAWNSSLGRTQIEAKAKTTAGIYKVNQDDLSTCVFPLPPAHEQCRIQSEIERLVSFGDAAIDLSARSKTRCARLRQSILKWAFEGRLVDQDPNDEPATVLLERIRAERTAAKGSKQSRTRRVNTRTASA